MEESFGKKKKYWISSSIKYLQNHFEQNETSFENELKSNPEILEEIEGKAIIWAHYQYDINTIIKEIKQRQFLILFSLSLSTIASSSSLLLEELILPKIYE